MEAFQLDNIDLRGLDFGSLRTLNRKNEPKGIILSAKVENWEFFDIPNEKYHAEIDALSASTLKHCTTPLDYRNYLDNPKYNAGSLITGTALHAMILEPEKFEYEIYDEEKLLSEVQDLRPDVKPENLKRTANWKEVVRKYMNENGELRNDVMTKATFQSLWKIVKRAESFPIIKDLFTDGFCEKSFVVSYDNGLTCKIRPDLFKFATDKDAENLSKYGVQQGDLIVVSVKTTYDGSPYGFKREARKLSYHLAEAFYQDVLRSIYPNLCIHTLYLCIEKNSKNEFTGNCMLYSYDKGYFKLGRAEYEDNLRVYMHCKSTGDYSQGYEFFNDGNILKHIEYIE